MVEECNIAQANYDSILSPKNVKLVNEGTRFRGVRVVFSPLSPFV